MRIQAYWNMVLLRREDVAVRKGLSLAAHCGQDAKSDAKKNYTSRDSASYLRLIDCSALRGCKREKFQF